MRVAGIDHLVLTVTDLEATIDFYTRTLGMTVQAFDGGRLALRFGRQKINLHEAGHEFEPRARSPRPGGADLCFVVEQPLSEWQEHLDGLGVTLVLGPVPRLGALGPMTSIYLRDPDGNECECISCGLPPASEEPATGS
jgi:catechol 2,3-dioxygenase-like lactoylglutathione lyase family enzyme